MVCFGSDIWSETEKRDPKLYKNRNYLEKYTKCKCHWVMRMFTTLWLHMFLSQSEEKCYGRARHFYFLYFEDSEPLMIFCVFSFWLYSTWRTASSEHCIFFWKMLHITPHMVLAASLAEPYDSFHKLQDCLESSFHGTGVCYRSKKTDEEKHVQVVKQKLRDFQAAITCFGFFSSRPWHTQCRGLSSRTWWFYILVSRPCNMQLHRTQVTIAYMFVWVGDTFFRMHRFFFSGQTRCQRQHFGKAEVQILEKQQMWQEHGRLTERCETVQQSFRALVAVRRRDWVTLELCKLTALCYPRHCGVQR